MDTEHSLNSPPPHGAAADDPSEMKSEMPPPAVHVEPEVPDPFIVDDGSHDDSDSDDGAAEHLAVGNTDGTPAAEDEIALAQSTILEPAAALNVDKPVPPPPDETTGAGTTGLAYDDDDDEDEEEDEDDEPPELYLPGLILPTMFLPIPNVCPSTCGCCVADY